MKHLTKTASLAVALGFCAAASGEAYLDPKGLGFDPFVPYDRLSSKELYPTNGGFSVSSEGHLLVNGKPRYLTATIWYGATELECNEDTPGYVDELKWLYQAMPGYENLQRLGLDGLGVEAPMEWMLTLNPKQRMRRRDDKKFESAIAAGLPVYVDFTAAEWGHGCLSYDEKSRAPGGHHFMPYSILTEEGRKVWLTMWTEGARETMKMGWRPWCYELMNEPASSELGSIDGSLRPVDRLKALEERFATLLEEGQAALKTVHADARACFQPTTMRTKGIDLYRSNENLEVVCAPTGGHGGAVEAHLLRALADGKPIVDSEMYVGCDTNSIRQSFLDQYQRGYNVSYMFKWSRRPSDWRSVHEVVETEGKWKGVKFWRMWPEESLKRVGKVSAYNFLCPYKVATDQLLGIRLAKREIEDVDLFFTPRDRGVKREVATVFSAPTERLTQCGGPGNVRLFDSAVTAVEYAHYPQDVIFEPQFTNTLDRISRYKVVVLAGVSAMYPGSWNTLKKWVEKGGRLVVLRESASLDEYGERNPEAPELQPGETPFGKGTIAFYPEKLGSLAMAEKIAAAASAAGVHPSCEMLDAVKDDGSAASSIEVTPARRGKLDAYMITSRAPTTPIVRFKPAPVPGSKKPMLVRIWTEPGGSEVPGADSRVRNLVSCRQPLKPDSNGYYVLTLNGGSQFYVYGDPAEILKVYPRTAADCEWRPELTAKQALANGRAYLEQEKAERAARMPVFDVDPNHLAFVRLHEKANLQNPGFKIPWGVTDWRGMRFDFIRFDQNQFKDVIAVDQVVRDIVIDRRVLNLYFCHTRAPVYRVRYEDGKTAVIAAKDCREVVGWKDDEGHSYQIAEWKNQRPEVKIASLDIAPAKGGTSYVAAITVQKPTPATVKLPPLSRTGGSGGVHPTYDATNGVWNVALDESAGNWCLANADFAQGTPIEPGKYTRLYFEFNRLPDADGNYHDHATVQLKLNGRDANGKLVFGGWRVPMYQRGGWAFRTDNDPETWQTVWIGIDKGTIPEHMRKIISIAVQFQMMPAEHSGVAFRNFRLEEGFEE